jgi:hypothetical protein
MPSVNCPPSAGTYFVVWKTMKTIAVTTQAIPTIMHMTRVFLSAFVNDVKSFLRKDMEEN